MFPVWLMLLLGIFTEEDMLNALNQYYLFAYTESGTNTLKELGSEIDFLGNTDEYKAFMELTFDKSFDNINETLTNKIRALSQEALKEKITKEEFKDRFNKEIVEDYLEGYSLERIVETEATTVVNYGRLEGAKQSTLNVLKEWLTQRDLKVRDSHLIDGQTKQLQEYFVLVDGNQAMYPGDPNLPAEDRINERCYNRLHLMRVLLDTIH